MEPLRAEFRHDVIGALESPDPAKRFGARYRLASLSRATGRLCKVPGTEKGKGRRDVPAVSWNRAPALRAGEWRS